MTVNLISIFSWLPIGKDQLADKISVSSLLDFNLCV